MNKENYNALYQKALNMLVESKYNSFYNLEDYKIYSQVLDKEESKQLRIEIGPNVYF